MGKGNLREAETKGYEGNNEKSVSTREDSERTDRDEAARSVSGSMRYAFYIDSHNTKRHLHDWRTHTDLWTEHDMTLCGLRLNIGTDTE